MSRPKYERHPDTGLTYNGWMVEVDNVCRERLGLSVHDLPDWNSYDTWDSGASPLEGAGAAAGASDLLTDDELEALFPEEP